MDRKKFENSSTLKNYYKAFEYFLHIVALLNKYCNKISNIEDVDHDVMATFLDRTLNLKYKHALLLYSTIFVFALFMFVYVSFTPLAVTIKDRRLY